MSSAVSYKTDKNQEAYRLLKLVKKVAPHKANMEQDYDIIQKAAMNKKKQEVIDEWVKARAGKTYIHINEKFNTCSYFDTWQSK